MCHSHFGFPATGRFNMHALATTAGIMQSTAIFARQGRLQVKSNEKIMT